MVSGIYGHIFIETISDGIFNNIMINYKIKDLNINRWIANIIINYYSFKDIKKEFIISIKGNDIKEAKKKVEYFLKKGNNKFEEEIEVDNPWIWKTSGELREIKKKENIIYELEVSEIDSKVGEIFIKKNIWFSNLKALSEEDNIERSLYFMNYGRKFL